MKSILFLAFFFVFLSVSLSALAVEKSAPVAIALKSTGDIRIRRAGQINWQPAVKNIEFYAGDRAFVGESGSLTLKYLQHDAQVRLNTRTIFEVTEDLPVNTKMDRKVALATPFQQSVKPKKSKSDQELEDFLSSYFNKAKSERETSENQFEDDDGGTGIDLEWKVKEREVRYPVGVMNIRSLRFPSQFTLVLDKGPAPQKMFGYLWKLEGSRSTVWTGVSSEIFENIQVPASGTYIFQAFTEDSRMKTSPLVVHAEKIVLNSKSARIVPKFVRFGDTVYIP